MPNNTVSGSTSLTLLSNGDTLNVTLLTSKPLYQTFAKGTSDYTPNWATDAESRPTIYPRVYSVMGGNVIPPVNVSWKYNGVNMTFDASGIATAPSIVSGKIQQIDYNGAKALKIIGNIASATNNDSDIITFTGRVLSTDISAEATLLIEESLSNLYRLFLSIPDDVIDGSQTSVLVTATLFNAGAAVSSGVEYEFVDFNTDQILRAKSTVNTFTVTRDMVDSQLVLVCKAYVSGQMIAQEQREIRDALDPYVGICDKGDKPTQKVDENVTYNYSVVNARTGAVVPGATFVFKIIKDSTKADITGEFTKTSTSVTVPGAKINEHFAMHILYTATF